MGDGTPAPTSPRVIVVDNGSAGAGMASDVFTVRNGSKLRSELLAPIRRT
jgi:hypothetical protein